MNEWFETNVEVIADCCYLISIIFYVPFSLPFRSGKRFPSDILYVVSLKHHVEITKYKGLDYTIKGTPKVIGTIS